MTYIFEALADIRLTTENIQKVIKMYPRDNDWKKLITKHRRDIDALRRGKDLPKKVEDELMKWALDNGEIKSDDADELDDFIDSIMNEGTVKENEELDEAKYTPKQYKMAFGVLNDPRWKGGNMTQIVSTIEKIAKGLSKDKAVAHAIQVTNE